jgi:hypothetical protein
MDKIKLFLTLLTILIAVVPVTVHALIHRENLVGLILPPSIADLFTGGTDDLVTVDEVDFAGMSFSLPTLLGDPVLFPNGTINLIYNFTNPLDGKITINSIDAVIVCVDHDFPLGDVYIEPATLEPNQTIELNVTGILTTQAMEHIISEHKGQNSINTEFKNFRVDLTGIKITMPHRKLGPIQLPLSTLTLNPIFR